MQAAECGATVGLDDLLADDWEIQEPTVAITRAQFWEAFDDALLKATAVTMDVKDLHSEIARKLGLDP